MSDGLLTTPLAIVGMSCRLPGGRIGSLLGSAPLRQSAVGEMPPDRLDRGLYYDPRKGVRGKTYTTLVR